MDAALAAEVAHAARVLADGGVVCYPTETHYGLGADALNPVAVARVVAAKGRAPDAPIAVIVPDLDAARRLWRELPAELEALARRHWPGPLTLVAPAREGVPLPLVGELGVGVRRSSHPVADALAVAFGGPITATSANLTGRPPADTVAAARLQLGDAVDCYLDGGLTPGGPPSTVVALSKEGAPRVLRAGAVSIDLLT